MDISLYDTTLRDGTQREGLSLSVADKLKIARELDRFGMHYIEGGWPGSNPKDAAFFAQAAQMTWQHAKIAAFGSTRRAHVRAEDDSNLHALLDARTPVVTLVGKSWTLHVTAILETTLAENLAMIGDSVALMKAHGKEVVYDAEHFFDGFRADAEYALATLRAAADAGADWLVLCDTNGGSLPDWIGQVVAAVKAELDVPLGIHTHNDGELAVANSLAGIAAGCRQVQGTINGYGERCGNANLIAVVPNLQLKMGHSCVAPSQLARLTELSRTVSEIANLNPDEHAAYVGNSAFAHKGGIHVAAVAKVEHSYQHIEPTQVGNRKRVVISELAGRGNVRMRSDELGITSGGIERSVLDRVKLLESKGFQFEAAEGSFELLVRRAAADYTPPFTLVDVMIVVEQRRGVDMLAEATVKLRVGDEVYHTAAEGNGPVNALDQAMRKALLPSYPELADVHLVDYKVRILDSDSATGATTRVLLEAARGDERWTTVGCSANIIEASWQALADSLELPLLRAASKKPQAKAA